MSPRLFWVSGIDFDTTLDKATWVETAKHLVQSGWEVTLIGEGQARECNEEGVVMLSLPRSKRYLVGQALYHWRILRILARERSRADIILFHQLSALWLMPLRLLKWRRGQRPLLVMDTRDLIDTVAGDWKARLRRSYFDLAHYVAGWWVDGQTTITQRMAELVRISPNKLWGIWPSGVTVGDFSVAQRQRIWPDDGEPIVLVYIGSLLEKRNLLPLCQAVARANREGMSFEFHIYGDGAARPALAKCAEEARDGIYIHAPVPHVEVPKLLAAAHLGVTSLPFESDRKYQASSPIKLFEYMAAGMPILATRNVCHLDVVGEHPFAFWIAEVSEDAMQQALYNVWQQRDQLAELGDLAAAQAGYWSWRAAAEKLEQALHYGMGLTEENQADVQRASASQGMD